MATTFVQIATANCLTSLEHLIGIAADLVKRVSLQNPSDRVARSATHGRCPVMSTRGYPAARAVEEG